MPKKRKACLASQMNALKRCQVVAMPTRPRPNSDNEDDSNAVIESFTLTSSNNNNINIDQGTSVSVGKLGPDKPSSVTKPSDSQVMNIDNNLPKTDSLPNSTARPTVIDNSLLMPEKNLRKTSIEQIINSSVSLEDSESELRQPQYILADLTCLSQLLSNFQCTVCSLKLLRFEIIESHGFSHKVSLICGGCGENHASQYSSARSKPNNVGKTSSRPDFDINKRAVSSFLAMGKGYAAVEQFSMGMGMAVMSKSTYHEKAKFLHEVGRVGAQLSLNEIRKKVRKAYQDLDPNIKEDDIIEMEVSYDGSWHTRGFSSKNGIGCVVDLLTG